MNNDALYPTVKTWDVHFTQSGKPGPPFLTHKWKSPVTSVSCDNPACKNGKLIMSELYQALVQSKKTDNGANGEMVFCNGGEFAGKKFLKPCQNSARVKISVVYK